MPENASNPAEGGGSEDSPLIVRDYLALDRTRLANERTLLAYVRTALTFLVAGVTLIKFFDDAWAQAAGWISIPTGIATLALGVWSFWRMGRRIGDVQNYGRPGHTDGRQD
jgi:putative membrane protein